MNLRRSLQEKLKNKDTEIRLEPEGPTTCRSILQYSTLRELYRDFGVEPPEDESDLDKDVDRRLNNFYLKIANGDIDDPSSEE